MQGRFPYKKLAKYPHMKPEDVVVWERFINNNPTFFDTVDYDLALGEGAPQNPAHPENIQRDGKILTQKKVDVVGYQNDITFLIELKPIADMRALGQILTYFALYTKERPNEPTPTKTVICGSVERELEPIYAQHEVNIEIV